MQNCLHILRANHDIQPCLSPYAMIEYILNYATKGQKVFLNAVETGQEEATFLLLQAAMTFMSRDSVFINTSPPRQRTFLIKSKKELEQMDPESTDIAIDNFIHHYQNRPHQMENYCLADFASKVNICEQTKQHQLLHPNHLLSYVFRKILFIGGEKKTE